MAVTADHASKPHGEARGSIEYQVGNLMEPLGQWLSEQFDFKRSGLITCATPLPTPNKWPCVAQGDFGWPPLRCSLSPLCAPPLFSGAIARGGAGQAERRCGRVRAEGGSAAGGPRSGQPSRNVPGRGGQLCLRLRLPSGLQGSRSLVRLQEGHTSLKAPPPLLPCLLPGHPIR